MDTICFLSSMIASTFLFIILTINCFSVLGSNSNSIFSLSNKLIKYSYKYPFSTIGFSLAFLSLTALFFHIFVSSKIMIFLTFLSFPSLILATVGVIKENENLAKWGIYIALFVGLYLPTLFISS